MAAAFSVRSAHREENNYCGRARVTRWLNAAAVSTVLELMFAEAGGRDTGLVTANRGAKTDKEPAKNNKFLSFFLLEPRLLSTDLWYRSAVCRWFR